MSTRITSARCLQAMPALCLNAIVMAGDTARELDIAFLSKSRELGPPDFNWYELGPDLAVEVISPNTRASDIHLKVMQVLGAGTRLIWLVYPETRTVEVHTAEGGTKLHEDDTLSGGDALPGFSMRVGDIFPC